MTDSHPGATSYRDRHGKVRWRYRRRGIALRLPEQPGHPAFEAAYRAAIEGRPAPKATILRHPASAEPRSMAAAWRSAMRTPQFKAQAPETQRRQDLIASAFLAEPLGDATWGAMPIADLRRRHVNEILADRAATPHAARHLLVVIRKMILAALDAEWIDADPTYRMRYKPPHVGWRAWTDAELAAFEARWPVGSTPRLAYALALWLGNRRGDVVSLRPQDLDGDVVRLVQGKTGRPMVLPVSPMLAECLAGADLSGPAILMTAYGRPFSAKSLTGRMADWTRAAGLPPGCTLHGLRKTLGKMLAEGGATTRQLMDTLGHTDIKHAELYSRDAEQARLARDGMKAVANRLANRRGDLK